MTGDAHYLGRFSFFKAACVSLVYALLLVCALFAFYSSVILGEGHIADRGFFIFAIPLFLILLPGVFYTYCGRPIIWAIRFHNGFCRIDCEQVIFCSGGAAPVTGIADVVLRRRRPKGRLYWLNELVLLPIDTRQAETIVGLFYLQSDRARFTADLKNALNLPR